MRIILIRHGQTPDNVAGALGTDAPGPGLTELGLAQARAVPEALASERVTGLYASKLVRTHLTAAPLAAALGLPVSEIAGLHEVEAGSLEGLTDLDAQREYMMTVFAWGQGDLELRMPDGPDGHEFFARYDEAITQIVAEQRGAGTAVVFSHGAAIRCWLAGRGENVDRDFLLTHPLENTGVVVIEGGFTTGWRIESWQGTPVGGEQLVGVGDDPTGESLADAAALGFFEEQGRLAGAELWPAAAAWIPEPVTTRLGELLAAHPQPPQAIERISRVFTLAARNARASALTPAEAEGRAELLARLKAGNAERTAVTEPAHGAESGAADDTAAGPRLVGEVDQDIRARRMRESRERRQANG